MQRYEAHRTGDATYNRTLSPAMQGSCLCGGVTVRIPPQQGVEVCHCTHCRRQCGTGTFLSVPPSELQVAGELAEHVGSSDAGNELRWYWCPTCGGKVYQTSSGFRKVSVHAGEPDVRIGPLNHLGPDPHG